jgi:hypothetical protein
MWGMTPPPAMVACGQRRGMARVRPGPRRSRGPRRSAFRGDRLSAAPAARARAWRGPGPRPVQVVQTWMPHLDQRVQLLVTADGQLQMAGGDTLHLRGGREGGGAVFRGGPGGGGSRRNRGGCGGRATRTLRSLEALPASSSTSAVRYSAGARSRGPVRAGGPPGGPTAGPGAGRAAPEARAWRPRAEAVRGMLLRPAAHPGWRRCRRQRWHRHDRWQTRGPAEEAPGRVRPGAARAAGAAGAGGRIAPAERAGRRSHLEQTVNPSHGELQAGPGRAGRGLLLVALLVPHRSLGTLARQALGSLAGHGCWSLAERRGEGGSGSPDGVQILPESATTVRFGGAERRAGGYVAPRPRPESV